MVNSIIYLIRNKLNNKFYIGSAVNGKRRFYHHRFYLNKKTHHNIKLQNSWNKHGEENFIFEIIEYVKDVNRLVEREQYYLDILLFAQEFIKNKDKRFDKLGYNINPTARSGIGKVVREEVRLKLAVKVIQYDLNGNFIKKWNSISEAARKLNLSAGNICGCCKCKPNKLGVHVNSVGGFIWRYENDNNKIEYINRIKKILQFDDEGIFIKEWEDASKAAKELNLFGVNILANCKGMANSAGGFIWDYKENDKKRKLPNSSKILQYTKDGKYVKLWNSVREIEDNMGVFGTSVIQCCRDKLKLVGGYSWEYYSHEFKSNKIKKKYKYLVDELNEAAKEIGIFKKL